MRELAILIFTTADGVMQAPKEPAEDRSGDFAHGGWAEGCWDEVMEQVRREAMAVPYDLLLGRRTYDVFAHSHGRNPQSPMNAATKYVVTSSPGTLTWANSKPLSGDVPKAVARLKREDGPLLQVHGSWLLCQTLLAHGLVDLYRLWTFPVMVGAGKRLFDGAAAPTGLELLKSESTRNGAVMRLYRRSP